jgi:hypothetical protein
MHRLQQLLLWPLRRPPRRLLPRPLPRGVRRLQHLLLLPLRRPPRRLLPLPLPRRQLLVVQPERLRRRAGQLLQVVHREWLLDVGPGHRLGPPLPMRLCLLAPRAAEVAAARPLLVPLLRPLLPPPAAEVRAARRRRGAARRRCGGERGLLESALRRQPELGGGARPRRRGGGARARRGRCSDVRARREGAAAGDVCVVHVGGCSGRFAVGAAQLHRQVCFLARRGFLAAARAACRGCLDRRVPGVGLT